MATNTVEILASLSAETLHSTIESHQGPSGQEATGPEKITTQAEEVFHYFVDVAASGTVTLWDNSDAHGVDEASIIWVLPTVSGHLEFLAPDSPAGDVPDEVNTIPIRKNVPLPITATDQANKLQAFINHSDSDALGNGTLADITQVRFKSSNADSPGRVEVIGFK